MEEHGTRGQFFRVINRSVKDRVQLGPLEMDERSPKILNDVRDLPLVNMHALDQPLVIILGVEAVRRQVRKVRDLDVNVGTVDIPARRL